MRFPPVKFGQRWRIPAAKHILAASGLLMAASCDKALPDKMEIPETRAAFSTEGDIPDPASIVARFGSEGQSRFPWTAPAGWKLKPSAEFRDLNFSFGPKNEGECYLSFTKGEEGATLGEANRWRVQMGAQPIDRTALEALPKAILFKNLCPFIDLTGNYTPAGNMKMADHGAPKEVRPDQRLLGLILEVPGMGAVITLKMVGPKDIVAEQVENFKTLASTLAEPAAP